MLFKLILFALRLTFSNWYALNVNFDLFSCDVTGGQVETCRCSIFSIFKQLKFRRNEKYFHYYSLDSPDTRGCRGRLRGASTIAPRVSRGMETNESLMLVPSNFLHSYIHLYIPSIPSTQSIANMDIYFRHNSPLSGGKWENHREEGREDSIIGAVIRMFE